MKNNGQKIFQDLFRLSNNICFDLLSCCVFICPQTTISRYIKHITNEVQIIYCKAIFIQVSFIIFQRLHTAPTFQESRVTCFRSIQNLAQKIIQMDVIGFFGLAQAQIQPRFSTFYYTQLEPIFLANNIDQATRYVKKDSL